jgi:hypothetical protein
LGGCGFFVVKSIEYSAKFEHGLYPGKWNLYYPMVDAAKGPSFTPEQIDAIHELESHTPGYWRHAMAHGGHGHGDDAHAGHGTAQAGQQLAAHAPALPHDHARHASVVGSTAGRAAAAPAGTVPAELNDDIQRDSDIQLNSIKQFGAIDLRTQHTLPNFDLLPEREKSRVHIFFSIYYAATGLHSLHVAIGMAVIAWLIVLAIKGRFSRDYYNPVDIGGLYWHLVDLIWIFLFPLMYLIH